MKYGLSYSALLWAPADGSGSPSNGAASGGAGGAEGEVQEGGDSGSGSGSGDSGTAAGTAGEGAEGTTDDSAAVAAAKAATAGVKPISWQEQRLAKKTGQLAEALAELAQKDAELAALRAGAPAAGGLSEEEVERRAEAKAEVRAQQLATQRAFNTACNAVADAGKSEFPDFGARIANLQKLVDPRDPSTAVAYNQFLNAAMEAGDAHRILHSLGDNLDEAARLMALPPVKLGIELARLAAKAPKAEEEPELGDKAPSGAPKPVRPLGGNSASHESIKASEGDGRSDRLSTREWMRRREAEVAARAAPGGGGRTLH